MCIIFPLPVLYSKAFVIVSLLTTLDHKASSSTAISACSFLPIYMDQLEGVVLVWLSGTAELLLTSLRRK